MATIHLEDCPFCGGPGKGKDIPNPFRHGWVGCPECGIYKQWIRSPTEAVRRWNTRAAPAREGPAVSIKTNAGEFVPRAGL